MHELVAEDVIGLGKAAGNGRMTRRRLLSVTPPVPSPISPRMLVC
jgi:hypothetical protein